MDWASIIISLIVAASAFGGTVYSSNKSQRSQDIKQDACITLMETKQTACIELMKVQQSAVVELMKSETKSALDSVTYHIQELEKKQTKHNDLISKVYKLENQADKNIENITKNKDDLQQIREDIRANMHRSENLESKNKQEEKK